MRTFRLSKVARFVAGPLVGVMATGAAGLTAVHLGGVVHVASSPFEVVVVNSANQNGATTARALQAGTTYVLEASGTFQHGKGEADAECATVPGDPRWLRGQYASFGEHFIDLLVGGSGVEWTPTSADANGCNTSNHRYEYTFVPASSGPLTLRVNDVIFTDNVGALTVTITEQSDSDPVGDAQEKAQEAQAEAQRALDDTTETVEQTKAKAEQDAKEAKEGAEAEAQRMRQEAEEEAQRAQDDAEAEAQRRKAEAEEDAQEAQDEAARRRAEAEAEAARRRAEAEAAAADAQRQAEEIIGQVDPGPVGEAVLGAIAELQAEADAAADQAEADANAAIDDAEGDANAAVAAAQAEADAIVDEVQKNDTPGPDPEPDPQPDPDPEPEPEPKPEPEPTPAPQPDPEPEREPEVEATTQASDSGAGGAGTTTSGDDEASDQGSTTVSRAVAAASTSPATAGDTPSSASGAGGSLPDDLFAFEFPDSDAEETDRRTVGSLDLPDGSQSRVPLIVTLVLVVGFTLALGVRSLTGARLARTQYTQRYR